MVLAIRRISCCCGEGGSATTAPIVTSPVNNFIVPVTSTGQVAGTPLFDAQEQVELTGLVPSFDGQKLTIVNVGDSPLILAHLDPASAASNQIFTPSSTDWVLTPGQTASLVYDADLGAWRIVGSTGTPSEPPVVTTPFPTATPTWFQFPDIVQSDLEVAALTTDKVLYTVQGGVVLHMAVAQTVEAGMGVTTLAVEAVL